MGAVRTQRQIECEKCCKRVGKIKEGLKQYLGSIG